jgi:hypothetical protein
MGKRKWKIVANVSLLSITGVCFGLAALVIKSPSSIDWVGSQITKIYKSSNKHQMEDALEHLAGGDEIPVKNLLDSWAEIKKTDRIYPFKREGLLKLSDYFHNKERFNELIILSEKWYGLDERDITASAFYFEGLCHSGDSYLEGELGLRSQFYKFPKNHFLQKFYSKLTEKFGDQDLFNNLIQKKEFYWRVFWDSGNNFNAKQSKRIKLSSVENRTWALEIEAVEPVLRWRLDLTPGVHLRVSEIKIITESGNCVVPLGIIKLHDMFLEDGEVIASGGKDPHFYFTSNICKNILANTPTTLHVQMRLTTYFNSEVDSQ